MEGDHLGRGFNPGQYGGTEHHRHDQHGGAENVHHYIHYGGYNQYPQPYYGQPVVIVGQDFPLGYVRANFKCIIVFGVILLVVGVSLISAGAVTLGPEMLPGAPILGFGGVALLAGIAFTTKGCIGYRHWRSQAITAETVVVPPPTTGYGPSPTTGYGPPPTTGYGPPPTTAFASSPSVISPGNVPNTYESYQQGFSAPQAPPSYGSTETETNTWK